ncbi:MAG: hypothetical protein KF744_12790 [Taibaiella sp.]|nr:hypothetical protein [Taibaiella sp.]
MKLFCTMALVALSGNVLAQDYCKQVKKEVSENKVQTDWFVPFKENNVPAVRVKHSISTDEDYPYDNFTAVFYAVCPLDAVYDPATQSNRPEKSLSIIFEDGSKIVDDTVEVNHDVTEDRTEATRFVFYPLTPDQINDITSKKISKFIIAGQERIIPPDSALMVMEYAKCMRK